MRARELFSSGVLILYFRIHRYKKKSATLSILYILVCLCLYTCLSVFIYLFVGVYILAC